MNRDKILQIPVEQLYEHKQNKKYFCDITGSDYDLLVQSIRTQGLLTPLLIAQADESSYTVLSGHQRLRAARDLGLQVLPCLLLETAGPTEQLDILTQANLGRSISTAERYKIAERLIELESDAREDNGDKGGDNKKLSDSAQNGQNRKPKRDRVAEQAGLTKHDMEALYKLKTLPLAEQQEFWDWLQSTNPNKKTIAEKLKTALKQNRQYKESDKELNQLKRKARLAKELQQAAQQIQTPEDYRDGQAIEELRTELATVRVASAEALGRIQAIAVPQSSLVLNWAQNEAIQLTALLRTQAEEIERHFGLSPDTPQDQPDEYQPEAQTGAQSSPILPEDDSDWD